MKMKLTSFEKQVLGALFSLLVSSLLVRKLWLRDRFLCRSQILRWFMALKQLCSFGGDKHQIVILGVNFGWIHTCSRRSTKKKGNNTSITTQPTYIVCKRNPMLVDRHSTIGAAALMMNGNSVSRNWLQRHCLSLSVCFLSVRTPFICFLFLETQS